MPPGTLLSMPRCPWAKNDLSIAYHDAEWGVPVRDDRLLFEFLILEGAQAGLSWDTVLAKRPRYRDVFQGFEIARVARMTDAALDRILADEGAGIVRNRLKVYAARTNAKAALAAIDEFGSLDACLWRFVGGAPKVNRFRSMAEVPAETDGSRAMSKDLKKRGFTFVGPTICYAFMQAVGMVNDHLVSCPRHAKV